jgi:hypothetical protein
MMDEEEGEEVQRGGNQLLGELGVDMGERKWRRVDAWMEVQERKM